ncbi:hypothetical protein BD410DRAFT_840293 [Rickenella mellea]|uniref:Uncharacterized protein n=1 Tax=Rickenella mellea TaxID=50990 RepID=A0A4Y7Q3S7_9AGAM|nr:hypothetical protein BD410DRAFT_840293 [Rickenella mellea]
MAQTRKQNADAHPGLVAMDVTSSRRSKEVVAAEKAEKAQKLKEKQAQEKQKLTEVAELEIRMAKDVTEANKMALPYNRPKRGATLQNAKPADKMAEDDIESSAVDSSDNFELPESALTEDDGDAEDGDADEPEETPKPKGKKSTKQKGATRKAIQALGQQMEEGKRDGERVASDHEVATGVIPRKASAGKGKSDKNKSKPAPLTRQNAMVPDWLELISIDAEEPKSKSTKSTASDRKPRPSAPASATTSARTTASNPIAIKKELISKSKAPKATEEFEPDADDFGMGIPPAFEETEREAALSSPIKGPNNRLSQLGIISIDDTVTPIKPAKTRKSRKRAHSEEQHEDEDVKPDIKPDDEQVGKRQKTSQSSQARTSKYTNKDLPIVFSTPAWRGCFIPTMYQWLGSYEQPWDIDDVQLLAKVKAGLEKIFPDHGEKIEIHSPPISVTTQRFTEWRSGLGQAALDAVDLFFAEKRWDLNKRKKAAVAMQVDFRFLYKKSRGSNKDEYSGLFRSELCLRTLAYHVSQINGHVRVPALGSIKDLEAKGALAMVATALERALKLWQDDNIVWIPDQGKRPQVTLSDGTAYHYLKPTPGPGYSKQDSERPLTFGVNWSDATRKYLKSVKRALKDGAIPEIMEEARVYAKDKGRASRGGGAANKGDSSDDDDPRCHIVDRSEPEDDNCTSCVDSTCTNFMSL